MDEVKIWAVHDDANVVPLASKGRTESESLLEDILVKNPDMLIPGLKLVGRQTPTEGGPLDLLGVDEDGKLVIFELKRGTLSRDAVHRSSTTHPTSIGWRWTISPVTYPTDRADTGSKRSKISRSNTARTSESWSH